MNKTADNGDHLRGLLLHTGCWVGVKLKLKLFFTSRLIWIRAESDEARVFILPGGLVLHPTFTVTSHWLPFCCFLQKKHLILITYVVKRFVIYGNFYSFTNNHCCMNVKLNHVYFCLSHRNVCDSTQTPQYGRPSSRCCAPWLNLFGTSWTTVCSSLPLTDMMPSSWRRRGSSESTHSPLRKGYHI